MVYTGAASIEEVDSELLSEVSAVLLRRCPVGEEQLAKAIQDLTSTKTSSADAAFSSAAWPSGSYATYAFV